MHQIERNIRFALLQIQKGNRKRLHKQSLDKEFMRFKSISDDKEFDDIYESLFDNSVIRNSYFTANLFPDEIKMISKYKECSYVNDERAEIRWHLKLFSKFASQLTDFVSKKMNYEEMILDEHYQEALLCLQSIEATYGISIWLLENKIFLYHKLNLNVKEEILDKADSAFVSIILYFFDMKASSELLARDYEYFVRKQIARVKRVYPNKEEEMNGDIYFIAPSLFEMTPKGIDQLLIRIRELPLIDRYLVVMDIIEYYVSKIPEERPPIWLKSLCEYLKNIEDAGVNTCRFILADIDDKLSKFSIEEDLIGIRNKFIQGKLIPCYEEIRARVENQRADIRVYNFYIELCQLCGYEVDDINVSSNKKKLIINLNKIYNNENNYKDALDSVYKMCFWSFHSKWASDVMSHITRQVSPIGSKKAKEATKYSNLHSLTIETVIENLSAEEAMLLITSKDFNCADEYKTYLLAILERNYKSAAAICKVKELSALLQLFGENTFEKYEEYLNSENIKLYKIRCEKLLWNSMQSNNDYEKGLDYFIHLFINREEYAMLVPVNRFMEYAKSCDSKSRKNLRISILYYIFTTYFDSSCKEDLSIACEDFLFLNNIDRPSEIKGAIYRQFNKEQIIFFLRYICIPQIMGPVLLSVRTSKELEQERISICQNLRNIDPENEILYDQEIKDITHKLFINDGVSTLESHKIQVNTEGIKTRINKDLKSVFNKYMYSRNSKFDYILDQIKSIEGGEAFTLYSFDTSQMFNEIITSIRNEFVLGAEYGLDAYLSLNIRHGTLTGQLRAPLINMNLLAEKNVESNEYEVSERWLFKLRNKSDREHASNAIIEFTKKTNRIIEYLKNELIQISTEEKPTNGIFNYSLTDAQIDYFQNYLTENCEFEDFIDNVFDELWEITEVNLEKMRLIIREDIKQRYMEAFARLQEVFKSLNTDFPEADQWIKEAQNDMDAELEKICDWFKRSADGQYSDFDLESAFQVGLQTIKNIHPLMKFKVNYIEKELTKKINGSSWKYFVSIFYIVFENISKYAKETDGVRMVDCILKSTQKGIYVKIENQVDCRGDLTDTERKIKTAMDLISNATYLARAKQEGGSGIPKIYKMLAIDIKLKPRVVCNLTEDKKRFQIEIVGDYY